MLIIYPCLIGISYNVRFINQIGTSRNIIVVMHHIYPNKSKTKKAGVIIERNLFVKSLT